MADDKKHLENVRDKEFVQPLKLRMENELLTKPRVSKKPSKMTQYDKDIDDKETESKTRKKNSKARTDSINKSVSNQENSKDCDNKEPKKRKTSTLKKTTKNQLAGEDLKKQKLEEKQKNLAQTSMKDVKKEMLTTIFPVFEKQSTFRTVYRQHFIKPYCYMHNTIFNKSCF